MSLLFSASTTSTLEIFTKCGARARYPGKRNYKQRIATAKSSGFLFSNLAPEVLAWTRLVNCKASCNRWGREAADQDQGALHWFARGSRMGVAPLRTRSTSGLGNAQVNSTSNFRESGVGSLKSKLVAGERLYGAFLVSFSSVVAEILGWAGYDFVVVDMEHGPGDIFATLPVLQALASTGTPAILRLPDSDPVLVKKALDVGPAGLMFPMIETGEAARNAVASCRYPPRGIRGAAYPIVRASRYGMDLSYLHHCEDDLLIMCQVESAEAVDRISEIADVEGVDCIQMGPLDLRASLGLLRLAGDSKPEELLRLAEQKVLSCERKVFLAGFVSSESSPKLLFERGCHLVSGAVDVGLLRDAAVADMKRNKPFSNNCEAV